jgi:amidase
MDGVFGISRTFDTLGHMAKSAGDLALLAKVMREDHVEERLLVTNGLAIGFVDPSIWSMAPEMCPKTAESDEQMVSRSWISQESENIADTISDLHTRLR